MQSFATGVCRIVDYAEIFPDVEMGHAAEVGRKVSDFDVVIASDQGDRNFQAAHEIGERCFQLRRDACGRVEEITRDDEMGGVQHF